eukprot:s287_g31.t1
MTGWWFLKLWVRGKAWTHPYAGCFQELCTDFQSLISEDSWDPRTSSYFRSRSAVLRSATSLLPCASATQRLSIQKEPVQFEAAAMLNFRKEHGVPVLCRFEGFVSVLSFVLSLALFEKMPWRAFVLACAVAARGLGHAMRQGHGAKQQASLDDVHCGARDEDFAEVIWKIEADPGCVNRVDFDGETALSGAIQKRRLDVVKLLLKSGAKANGENGDNPLFMAAHYGYDNTMADIIRELVRYGAKVDQRDENGITPLFTAVRHNAYFAVKALLKFKANANIVDIKGGMQDTPLHDAVDLGHAEIVKLLVNAKANLNAKDINGMTPLSVSVMKGEDYRDRLMTPRRLLVGGAEVNAVNNQHQTALHLAVWDPDAVQLLLEHGADVNVADENGTTPLMAAVDEKEVEVVEMLLHAKAEVNVKRNHWSPLHEAAKKNSLELTKLLLAAKADVNPKDEEGHTPYDYAAAESEVAALLKKHGGAGSESWRLWGGELKTKLKKKIGWK